MALPKMALSVISLVLLALMVATSKAQNTPQDYLRPHNKARREVGNGPMRWDPALAKHAQDYANKLKPRCRLVPLHGQYGENLAWSRANLTAAGAVNSWVAEKPYYNYDTNSCMGGRSCFHYTQVVWKKSVWLGCAKVRCDRGLGAIIVCFYNPKGNIPGERPYDTFAASSVLELLEDSI